MSVEDTFSGSAVESKGHKPSSGLQMHTHRLKHYIHVHRGTHTRNKEMGRMMSHVGVVKYLMVNVQILSNAIKFELLKKILELFYFILS